MVRHTFLRNDLHLTMLCHTVAFHLHNVTIQVCNALREACERLEKGDMLCIVQIVADAFEVWMWQCHQLKDDVTGGMVRMLVTGMLEFL